MFASGDVPWPPEKTGNAVVDDKQCDMVSSNVYSFHDYFGTKGISVHMHACINKVVAAEHLTELHACMHVYYLLCWCTCTSRCLDRWNGKPTCTYVHTWSIIHEKHIYYCINPAAVRLWNEARQPGGDPAYPRSGEHGSKIVAARRQHCSVAR
jgi:hypothetical protein